LFQALEKIHSRPLPFQFDTAEELWTDPHTSKKMLALHLDEKGDVSSRNRLFIDRSVRWIVAHFHINASTDIADFGCGPGLYTTRLAETGAQVTGIDFSERSIHYANNVASKKGLKITYVKQNYLEFETDKRFDLILMIMCDFCALSPEKRDGMVCKFHKILKPGGSVLLDVYSLNSFNQRKEDTALEHNLLDGFWSPGSYYGFLNTFKYDTEKVILDKYTIIEEARTRTVYNWMQYFSQDSLRQEFEDKGFDIEGFYSDVAGTAFNPDSLEMAMVARKPIEQSVPG
jgi:2-polyprenyl-3-methyl-5-hydroxy-6-metoxy-1,4-benzoquinol methylase